MEHRARELVGDEPLDRLGRLSRADEGRPAEAAILPLTLGRVNNAQASFAHLRE